MATNSNLLGNWWIKAAGFSSGMNSVPNFQVGYKVVIDDGSITVIPGGSTTQPTPLAQGVEFHLGPGKMRADFSYTTSDGTHSAYLMCIPGASTGASAIIGGSTVGDPDTVAVWGGDDVP